MQAYLDQESDKLSDINVQIRLHFCNFLHKLIDSVSKEKRSILFNSITRVNLFNLCDKWSGRFSLTQHVTANTNQQQQVINQSVGSGLLSLRFSNSNNTTAQASTASGSLPNASVNPNQFFIHTSHYNHHKCYHYYEELELAATKACAEILCCGDTFEKLSSSSPNSTLTNSTQATDFSVGAGARNSIVFVWLSQLLENANVEMKMYEKCKCALPNEIYMLSLNVCIQLLDISLNKNVTSATTPVNVNKNNSIFEWIIRKCYSSISQEIADLCFIALARVYIDYSNENWANLTKNKAVNKNQNSPLHQQNATASLMSQQTFDNSYLSKKILSYSKFFFNTL
jgi:hypothetical protein